ncbi:MAG: ABC transporter substrate-binding protein [Deltaproteobacteria bacterium]|nr:ABC transporter substrate-binding protein [Deltaproteobacteria bacterium]
MQQMRRLVVGILVWVMTGMIGPIFIPAFAADKPEGEKPRYGGELVVALEAGPAHLNPAISSGLFTGLPGAQLFASPLRYDEKWQPQPYLAEKWDVSPDGRAVTLHLVKGATFHDGRPITSKDVEFSIRTVQTYHPFKNMFAAVEKVDTPDPWTAIVRLRKPSPAILMAMSSVLLPIIPQHIYGDGRDIRTHPANLAPVGSGPFKFVEFVPGQQIVLEKYKDFFIKGRPYLDRIRYKIFRHPELEMPMSLEAGESHMIFSSNIDGFQRYEKDPRLVVTSMGYKGLGALFWLTFNLQKKPFNDLRVRQAVSYCIDRDFIVQTLLKGTAQKATGPISPDSPFYSTAVEQFGVNIEKANDLLDAAGYPRDAGGRRFQAAIDYPSEGSTFVSFSEYLRQDLLRKIGVELIISKFKGYAQWADKISNGRFDLNLDVVFNWGDPMIGVHRTYDCDNIKKGLIYSNNQGYCNPEVNRLMEAAGSEMNFAKRKALYAEFQRLVVRDLPIYYLFRIPHRTIYHKELAGIDDNIWGALSPMDQVYWRNKP